MKKTNHSFSPLHSTCIHIYIYMYVYVLTGSWIEENGLDGVQLFFHTHPITAKGIIGPHPPGSTEQRHGLRVLGIYQVGPHSSHCEDPKEKEQFVVGSF